MRKAQSRRALGKRVHLSRDDHRKLPDPVRWEDMTATQPVRPAADPTMGRDTDTEFMLKNAGFAPPI